MVLVIRPSSHMPPCRWKGARIQHSAPQAVKEPERLGFAWAVGSPATLAALVLFLKPGHQRPEIGDHRGAVHLARAGEGFQRIWPRLRRAQLQHRVQALADLPVTIEGAAVERPLPARLVARGLRSEEHTSELQSLMRLPYVFS